ncbi:ATP-binding protein [Azospirillum sp. INR13]|uniref:ATP-binding protein n=1 Tax=Azospirillum sp. INR13 TaxID=2596919 RepID=UPI0018923A2E|nr:ATP-binding protein [Azospirillum sp. INR13]
MPEPIVIDLGQPINLLRGRNAAGKSQFARALTWGLTGIFRVRRLNPSPRGIDQHLHPAAADSSGRRDSVSLPVIVPFPEGSDLACRSDGKPLLATSVTMTFEATDGTARVCLRRTLAAEKKGFSCPLEVIDPAGSVRPVASVHEVLGVSEIAVEAAALTMARLPVLQLDSPNALTRGIAVLTGLHPLKILGERLKTTVRRYVKTEIPKDTSKTLKEIEGAFQKKVDLISQQFRLGEALPAEVLPAPPAAADEGAACAAGLTALAAELNRRDTAMREAIRAATGLDVEAADLKVLRKKIDAARQALHPDNLSRLAEFTTIERMRTLSSADLDSAEALLANAQVLAKAFARLDADKRQAARRRLYTAIDQWRHANNVEASWPPDCCPVCASDLSGRIDGVLGKPVRDALTEAERDEAALNLDADDWNRRARQDLHEALPLAVRQALDAQTGTAPSDLFRTAYTTAAARTAGLTGDLAPLAAELEAEVARSPRRSLPILNRSRWCCRTTCAGARSKLWRTGCFNW